MEGFIKIGCFYCGQPVHFSASVGSPDIDNIIRMSIKAKRPAYCPDCKTKFELPKERTLIFSSCIKMVNPDEKKAVLIRIECPFSSCKGQIKAPVIVEEVYAQYESLEIADRELGIKNRENTSWEEIEKFRAISNKGILRIQFIAGATNNCGECGGVYNVHLLEDDFILEVEKRMDEIIYLKH